MTSTSPRYGTLASHATLPLPTALGGGSGSEESREEKAQSSFPANTNNTETFAKALIRRASSALGAATGNIITPQIAELQDQLVMRSPAFHSTDLSKNLLFATTPHEHNHHHQEESNPLISDSESEGAPFPASHQRRSSRFDALSSSSSSPDTSHKTKQRDADGIIMSIIYGLVNVAVSVPCLYGYAGIIYRDPTYAHALPDLAKLVILSSAIHQLIFSLRSNMPFAIGQVQDAGLIFLSSMASRIATNSGYDPQAATTTAVIVLPLCTALLGFIVILVGRFRLASFVSLIPTPVIAGYLAFIGFFCGAAGLGLACDKDISMLSDFTKLNETRDWILITPALLTGMLLSSVSRNATKWYTLPLVIVCIPLLFYVWMWFTSMSFQQARLAGWIGPQAPSESVFVVASFFDLSLVRWSVIPQLVLTFLSMCLVVTFASALDVVAVEIDLKGEQLDIDRELETVGYSNLISGMLAGYTGSYIFSQTIFTRRTLTTKRWIGLILAFVELTLFVVPFSLMAYVPRFFFAGTLIYIAADLLRDWLFDIYFRTTFRDYLLIVITFGSITLSNDLVLGIFVGTCTATLNFIVLYAHVDPVIPAGKSSNVLRDYEARKVLVALASERIISLKLNGFLFFGSSTLILRRVRDFLKEGGGGGGGGGSGYGHRISIRSLPPTPQHVPEILRAMSAPPQPPFVFGENVTVTGREEYYYDRASLSYPERLDQLDHHNNATTHRASFTAPWASEQPDDNDVEIPPNRVNRRYLILDFASVTGLDATVVSSGLMRIKILAKTHNVCIIFSSLNASLLKLLISNHIVGAAGEGGGDDDAVMVADNLNDALEIAETELLAEVKSQGGDVMTTMAPSSSSKMFVLESSRLLRYPSQPQIPPILWEPFDKSTATPAESMRRKKAESRTMASFALLIESFFGWGPGGKPSMTSEETKRLGSYFSLLTLRKNEIVFDEGAVPDRVCVIVTGEVTLYRVDPTWRKATAEERAMVKDPLLIFGEKREIIQRARFGSMVGDLNFTLQQKRVFGALVAQDACMFVLTRESLKRMEDAEPHLAVGLLKMIARSLAITLINLEAFMESDEL